MSTLIDTTLVGNVTAWRDFSGQKVMFAGCDGRGRLHGGDGKGLSLEAVLHKIMKEAGIESAHVEMSIRLTSPEVR